MSIMILRGPEAASSLVRGPQALPRAVITQLVRCARDAGKTVSCAPVGRSRSCWMPYAWPGRRAWRSR